MPLQRAVPFSHRNEQESEAAYAITEEGAKITNCAPTNQKHKTNLPRINKTLNTQHTHIYSQLVDVAMATVRIALTVSCTMDELHY